MRWLMIPMTVREEIVAPVTMSTSLSLPEPAPDLTPSSRAAAWRNPATNEESFMILSPRPGVSLLSRTFIASTRSTEGS